MTASQLPRGGLAGSAGGDADAVARVDLHVGRRSVGGEDRAQPHAVRLGDRRPRFTGDHVVGRRAPVAHPWAAHRRAAGRRLVGGGRGIGGRWGVRRRWNACGGRTGGRGRGVGRRRHGRARAVRRGGHRYAEVHPRMEVAVAGHVVGGGERADVDTRGTRDRRPGVATPNDVGRGTLDRSGERGRWLDDDAGEGARGEAGSQEQSEMSSHWSPVRQERAPVSSTQCV